MFNDRLEIDGPVTAAESRRKLDPTNESGAQRRGITGIAMALVLILGIGNSVTAAAPVDQPATLLEVEDPPLIETFDTVSTPYLPFDMPVGTSDRKVFAHYVPWLPISIDNFPGDVDYYQSELLNPHGERGIHSHYGGYLRDRPMPRLPIGDPNWQMVDAQTEVAQAKSIGINGFSVDVTVPIAQAEAPMRLMSAAELAGDFAVQVTSDMSGAFGADYDENEFAAEFAPLLRHPAAQRLSDGRTVLGAFYAERKPAGWWLKVLQIMRDRYHVDAAFVPTFLDAASYMDAFAPFSFGFSNWGGRNPSVLSPSNTGAGSPISLVRRAKGHGKLWMQPIAFQDNRPRAGIFEESENGTTNRNAWKIAIDEHAEWANIITWNDYAEMTAVAPSAKHGWRMLDREAYWVSLFKYGIEPAVIRDALYVSSRSQMHAAVPSLPDQLLMNNIGATPARDTVEVESFARAPSTVTAWIGGATASCTVPAGLGVCTFPLQPGAYVVSLKRDGAEQVVVRSPFEVTETPHVQDLQYVVTGGLR